MLETRDAHRAADRRLSAAISRAEALSCGSAFRSRKNRAAALGFSQNRPRPDAASEVSAVAVALGVAARRRAKAFVTGIELAKLQETMSEIEPGRRIVGLSCSGNDESIRPPAAFSPSSLMRSRHAEQRVGRGGGNVERSGKSGLGLGAISQAQENVSELDRQFRHHRRDAETVAKSFDRLVVAFEQRQQTAEFEERRRKRRLPFHGALDPGKRLFGAARLAQRDASTVSTSASCRLRAALSSGAIASAARPCMSRAQPRMCRALWCRGSVLRRSWAIRSASCGRWLFKASVARCSGSPRPTPSLGANGCKGPAAIAAPKSRMSCAPASLPSGRLEDQWQL